MFSKLTREQAEQREQLLFHRSYDEKNYEMGGVAWFDEIPVETAKKLIDLGFVDPADTQNLSPTMQEMVDFCDDGTGMWYLHGYAVSPNRYDCRVTFEGVGSNSTLGVTDAVDFMWAFRFADELSCEIGSSAYCWFD